MYIDDYNPFPGFELKEFHKYSDEEMIELELKFGHDYYIVVKKERDFRLRKLKINNILKRK